MRKNHGKNDHLLTQERLKSLLHYDPLSGAWTWVRSRGSVAAGKICHYPGNEKYLDIQIYGIAYKAHRLAFLYMRGAWPTEDSDHRDGNKNNGEWDNLRDASPSQNAMNAIMGPKSKLPKGVTFRADMGLFRARIKTCGGRKTIGYFDCPAAAHFAYIIEADKIFGEFARAA